MSFLCWHYFRSVLTLRISPDPGRQRVRPQRNADADQDSGIQLMECDKAFWGILISHLEVDIQNVSCNLSNATKDKCDSPITVSADIFHELVKYFCVNVFEKDFYWAILLVFREYCLFSYTKKDFLHLISILYSHYKFNLTA